MKTDTRSIRRVRILLILLHVLGPVTMASALLCVAEDGSLCAARGHGQLAGIQGSFEPVSTFVIA